MRERNQSTKEPLKETLQTATNTSSVYQAEQKLYALQCTQPNLHRVFGRQSSSCLSAKNNIGVKKLAFWIKCHFRNLNEGCKWF